MEVNSNSLSRSTDNDNSSCTKCNNINFEGSKEEEETEFESLLKGSTPIRRKMDTRNSIWRAVHICGCILIVLGCIAFIYGGIALRDYAQVDYPLEEGPRAGRAGYDGGEVSGEGDEDIFLLESRMKPFHVSKMVEESFVSWSKYLNHLTELDKYRGGEPSVNWDWHPRNRSDRFPSVEERIQYYMGEWYDRKTPMYGPSFLKKIWTMHRTTRKFGLASELKVDPLGYSPMGLKRCYEQYNEKNCRDVIDFAILHYECTAGSIWQWGDKLVRPGSWNKKLIKGYPVMNKVRNFCTMLPHFEKDDLNSDCESEDMVSTILWPLTRVRHFRPAVDVSDSDIPWEKKTGKLIWRGGVKNDKSKTGHMKWTLVSNHVNSTLVDAKFAEKNEAKAKSVPKEYRGPFISQKKQLENKYLVSIEGNDVSTGLKWMLFSNSLVFMPSITYESWAMEGLLEPFVHFIPLKSDMSNLEEQIEWAESNPEDAQKIAQRSTLFIYDLLFHPDALHEEQLILKGIVERYENNFGYSASIPVVHPISHIDFQMHPEHRTDRFPSVEERLRYYMGKWFKKNNKVSMVRGKNHPVLDNLGNVPQMKNAFIASGEELEKCANSSRNDFPVALSHLCNETLPYFDERLIHDIDRVHEPKRDPSFKLDDRFNERKWYQRILVDNSLKVIHFGDGTPATSDFPIFANSRNGNGIILWRFGEENEYELVYSGLIEKLDMNFESKTPHAVWRGGLGSILSEGTSAAEFENREKLVKKFLDSAGAIDAKFSLSDDELQQYQAYIGNPVTDVLIREPIEYEEKSIYMRNILSFRYLVATNDDFRSNPDLKWMLLSRSVVLMPQEQRFSSWFMEDQLEPYVHFVPIDADYANVEEQIAWCENNLFEAKRISERASLFVHDLLFHRDSERDNAEIQLRIMEKYSDQFGT